MTEIGDGVVEEDEIQDAADDTPIVRFVNKVLLNQTGCLRYSL